MGGLRRRRSHLVVVLPMPTATAAALAFLIFASAFSAIKATNPTRKLSESGNPSKLTSETAQSSWFSIWAALISRTTSSRVRRGRVGERELVYGRVEEAAAGEAMVTPRRLIGPGSSPPTCRSRCGRCSPCKAVHVPIRTGWSMTLEYYPEAWRCKCGNKLYMP